MRVNDTVKMGIGTWNVTLANRIGVLKCFPADFEGLNGGQNSRFFWCERKECLPFVHGTVPS